MSNPPTTDPSTLPTQQHITLLLKTQKSTTLLSVLPTQSLSSIKVLLLSALKSRHIASLPDSPEDIEFGVLVDRRDVSKGWTSVEDKVHGDGGRSGSGGKGKEKGKKKAGRPRARPSAGGSVVGDTPEALGLGDGGFLAYRIRRERKGKGREKETEKEEDGSEGDGDEDDDEEDDDGDMMLDGDGDGNDKQGWDVVLPSFDDEDRERDELDAMIDVGVNGR